MGPIRGCADITTMDADSVRPISLDDFKDALRGVCLRLSFLFFFETGHTMKLNGLCLRHFQVRSSVATKDLEFYKQWNDEFGSFAFQSHED